MFARVTIWNTPIETVEFKTANSFGVWIAKNAGLCEFSVKFYTFRRRDFTAEYDCNA